MGLCGEGQGCRPPGSRKRCSHRTRSSSCFCLCKAPSGPGRRRTSPSWLASAPRTCGRGMRHAGDAEGRALSRLLSEIQCPGLCPSRKAQPTSRLLYFPPVFLKTRSSILTLFLNFPVWEILCLAILLAASFTIYSEEYHKRNSTPS